MVDPNTQETIRYRQLKGRNLEEGMLLAGLQKFAKTEDNMPALLGKNYKLPFDDELAQVQGGLLKHPGDHDLYECVMTNGDWKGWARCVVIEVMVTELWLGEYR